MMWLRHSIPIRILGALLLGFLVFKLFECAFIYRETLLLRDEMAVFIVPEVEQNGATYAFDGSTVTSADRHVSLRTERDVLRLMRLAVESRINPVFGIEGTDLDAFERSIDALEASLDDFAPLYLPDEEERIREYLYPIKFLKQLAETERLRREFTAEASEARAEEYHNALLRAIEFSHTYTSELSGVFTQLGEAYFNSNTTFKFLSGGTSIDHITSYLEDLLGETEDQALLVEARLKCYSGEKGSCQPLIMPVEDDVVVPASSFGSSDVPAHITENLKILSEHYSADSAGTRIDTSIPLFSIKSSTCFSDMGTVYYHPRWMNVGGAEAFYITYVNDLFLHDLSKREHEFFNALKKKDVRYLYQPTTNYYMCPDIAYDTADVAKLYFMYKELIREPLFRTLSDDTEEALGLQKLIELEEHLVNAEVIEMERAALYAHEMENLLRTRGEIRLSERLGRDTVLRIEHLLLVFDQGTPNFDEMIFNVIRTNSVIQPLTVAGDEIGLAPLFFTRTFTPVLLALHNKSVIRERIFYLEQFSFAKDHPTLVSYNDVLSKELLPEEIILIMEKGRVADYSIRGELTKATTTLSGH